MALWALAVLVATLMLLRGDAPVHGYQWLILALSGLVGIVGCAYACSRPIVSMQLEGTTAQVVERRPFSARITRCSLNEIRVPAISENDVDSDGDPYFRCFLSLPGSHEVEVAGSHRRCEITAIRTRILVAIATQRGVDK